MNRPNLRFEPLSESDRLQAYQLLEGDADAAEEYLRALSEEPEMLTGAWIGSTLAALALTDQPSKQSYLGVFVAPPYRRQGVGSAVAAYAEAKLREGGTREVLSTFPVDAGASRAFAEKHGYQSYFASARMERSGGPFPLKPLPVRSYRDSDYEESQAMYARAFHEMRMRVGCFPDSVIARPSEQGRQAWNADAKDRFVWEEHGKITAFAHLCGNEISSVSVRTDCQGRGIGRQFVMYLCNEIYRRGNPAVTLFCVVGNYARNLYESLGFQETGIFVYPRKTL